MKQCCPVTVELTAQEKSQIKGLIEEISDSVGSDISQNTSFWIDHVAVAAGAVPERIRACLYGFKREEQAPWILLKNLPVAIDDLPKTPGKAGEERKIASVCGAEILHCLLATLLGEPFGWSTHQSGRVVTDVLPELHKRHELSGAGSRNDLGLHTEDAFHRNAPEYLGLLCLRNPDRTPTVVSLLESADLSPKQIEVLRAPRFVVGVNAAHDLQQPSRPEPILFGALENSYNRFNMNKQRAVEGDLEAAEALEHLEREFQRHSQDLLVLPGQAVFIDNFRVVHGRRAYKPKFDGTDRWFKRVFVTSSLRPSRHLRESSRSRVVHPTVVG